MTDLEKEFIETAILWRQSQHTVERAILFERMKMVLDLVRKERRITKGET